jgi:hypothetical protein
MMTSPYQDSNLMYNQGYVDVSGNFDKVYMGTGLQAHPAVQQTSAPSNASTWTGNDVESVGSADSYWENTGHMGPHIRPQQQMYMNEQSQDPQHCFVPVPMMSTPYGLMPLAGPGSPMSQGSPMSAQGTPLAMSPMGNSSAGMAVMQAMPGPMQAPADAAPVATGMAMQPMVGGAAPQRMMMQPLQTANGEGVQMMSPVAAVAVIPAGMAMPGTAMNGMGIPVALPQGYMPSTMSDAQQNTDQSPTGGKKTRLLEDLLPGGVRRRATREELGRKVFVGGLNPTTTTENLRTYFSDFGVVTDSCVITDASSKTSRGFGFVEFEGKIPEGLLDQQHIIDQRRCGVREYGNSSASP